LPRSKLWLIAAGCGTFGLVTAAPVGCADELPVVHFKVLGSVAETSHYKQFEEPFWSRRLTEDSGGRVTAEIAPFDKAGLTASKAVQLTRLGVISFLTVQAGMIAPEDPEANAPALPGVSPTSEDTKIAAESWKPIMSRVFSERYGLDVLAQLGYPAQVMLCVEKFTKLRDLAGRTIRTSTVSQTDFVESLGARGVVLPLGETRQAVIDGSVDCSITGTVTANLIGLSQVARYIYTTPISWGLELVVVNHQTWLGLDPKVREFVTNELSELEADMWRSSATATRDGFACAAGLTSCLSGIRGDAVLVEPTPDDETLIREILVGKVLPKWADRCGPDCTADWNRLIGQRIGITATMDH
jgi:TRAP-type C4-dicarboxylate transport system substrate-binding protein